MLTLAEIASAYKKYGKFRHTISYHHSEPEINFEWRKGGDEVVAPYWHDMGTATDEDLRFGENVVSTFQLFCSRMLDNKLTDNDVKDRKYQDKKRIESIIWPEDRPRPCRDWDIYGPNCSDIVDHADIRHTGSITVNTPPPHEFVVTNDNGLIQIRPKLSPKLQEDAMPTGFSLDWFKYHVAEPKIEFHNLRVCKFLNTWLNNHVIPQKCFIDDCINYNFNQQPKLDNLVKLPFNLLHYWRLLAKERICTIPYCCRTHDVNESLTRWQTRIRANKADRLALNGEQDPCLGKRYKFDDNGILVAPKSHLKRDTLLPIEKAHIGLDKKFVKWLELSGVTSVWGTEQDRKIPTTKRADRFYIQVRKKVKPIPEQIRQLSEHIGKNKALVRSLRLKDFTFSYA